MLACLRDVCQIAISERANAENAVTLLRRIRDDLARDTYHYPSDINDFIYALTDAIGDGDEDGRPPRTA